MRILWVSLIGVAVLVLLARPRAPEATSARDLPAVALVGGVPGEAHSALYLVRAGAPSLPPAAARFEHLPGAVVRGRTLPSIDGRPSVLVVADRVPEREGSWAAMLLRLSPGTAPEILCDRVYHASRPLVTDDGRVLVERGRAGAEPGLEEVRAGLLRNDDLSVDEIIPGGTRSRWRTRGYTTHLAGARGDALYVYHVAPDGAALVALDLRRDAASQQARVVARFTGPARDFSLDDAGRLVFTTHEAGAWRVERMDPSTGARAVLQENAGDHPAPHARPGGAVAWNPDGDTGLALLGGSARAPLGAGVDLIRAVTRDGEFAALHHFAPGGGLPEAAVVRTQGGAAFRLPGAPGVRLEIAGFVDGGAR